jgi:hypothetical protein
MTTDNRPRPLHQRIADVATALAESHDHGLPHAALLLLREALPIVRAAETPPKADADIVSRLRNLAGFSTSNLSPTEVNLLRRDLHAAADHIENDLRQFGALADYLMANHGQRGSETGDEARARLDPMAVAPGGPGCTDPAGEGAVEAALRLLKFAMDRGAFAPDPGGGLFSAGLDLQAALELMPGNGNGATCTDGEFDGLYAMLLAAAKVVTSKLSSACWAMHRANTKARALWQLLDDVDTADDIAKSNDVHFRELARAAAAKRERHYISLDGQTLVEPTVRQHIDLQGGKDPDKMLRGFSEPMRELVAEPGAAVARQQFAQFIKITDAARDAGFVAGVEALAAKIPVDGLTDPYAIVNAMHELIGDPRARLATSDVVLNLNDQIRVRLTDAGKALRTAYYADLCAAFGKSEGEMIPTSRKDDAGGWSTWSLWEFASAFGPGCKMGLPSTVVVNNEVTIIRQGAS